MTGLCGAEMLGRLLCLTGAPDLAGVDARRAAQTAVDWRLGARLFARIREHGLERHFAPDVLQSLREQHLKTVMRNRAFRRRAMEVLRALDAAGLTPVVMKGGVDLLGLPEGAECLRFMEDLDLLVPAGQCAAAYAVLARLGFEITKSYDAGHHHHGSIVHDPRSALSVEVHGEPLETARDWFTNAYFAEAETCRVENDLVLRFPTPPHQILHNMAHAQESHASFTIGTADLRHLLEFAEKCRALGDDMPWEWLIAAAERCGLRLHLLSWIYAAHRIFGLRPPAGMTFPLTARHQFRHIRSRELSPAPRKLAERFAVYHLLAWQGVYDRGDLGLLYRHWLAVALRNTLPASLYRPPKNHWPPGRLPRNSGHNGP